MISSEPAWAPGPWAITATREASSAGVTFFRAARAEWKVYRWPVASLCRRKSSGSSVSIVLFELGTISPILDGPSAGRAVLECSTPRGVLTVCLQVVFRVHQIPHGEVVTHPAGNVSLMSIPSKDPPAKAPSHGGVRPEQRKPARWQENRAPDRPRCSCWAK